MWVTAFRLHRGCAVATRGIASGTRNRLLFGSTCDKSATAGAGQWPRMASPRVGGHGVKNRLALAFVALGLTGAAAPAAELSVAPLYRPVPFVPRQTIEWTGIYFGANAGYGWGSASTLTTFTPDSAITGTTAGLGSSQTELNRVRIFGSGNPSGPLAGGQFGFNWQAGWFVFGAEVDAQWTEQRASFGSGVSLSAGCAKGGNCVASDTVKMKSLLTGRARAGVAFDWFLPYVTAGAAVANVSDDLVLTAGGVTGAFNTHSDSRLGWAAGAGVDIALTSNWSVRLEYLHVAIQGFQDNQRIPIVLGTGFADKGIDIKDDIVRVGVNYRFGPRGGPGVIERPIVASGGYASAYNFLPSITTYADSPIFAEKANGAKPAPSATVLATGAPQREAPSAAWRGTERAPAVAVAGEVPLREAPIAAAGSAERAGAAASEPKVATANAPKGATPNISRFADIEDSDDSVRLTSTGAAITLPTMSKRQNAGDDSRRLKSIMSICSGC